MKYSMNYEGGKCPFGFEFVNAHSQGGKWIDSYCRKIRKFRLFNDPDAKKERMKEKMEAQSLRNAKDIFWSSRENNGGDVEKL